MMLTPPLVTFVIVSFNTAGLLEECLGSIERYADMPYRIVVVDNASKDGSVDMVHQRFPDIELIANATNEGFPTAVNRGLGASASPYYFILNSDVRLTAHTLSPLIAHMETHPSAGLAAPFQRTPDGTPLLSAYDNPTLVREIARNLFFTDVWRYRLLGSTLAAKMTHAQRVDWVMGAALFVRREMIERVGLMDETVFMYGEEFDWAFRAWQVGWEVYLVPESLVVHHKSASAGQAFRSRRYSMVVRSNYYFFAKHFGLSRLPLFVLAQVIGSILRAFAASLLFLVGAQEARFQIQEHLHTILASLDPTLYRWIFRALSDTAREKRSP